MGKNEENETKKSRPQVLCLPKPNWVDAFFLATVVVICRASTKLDGRVLHTMVAICYLVVAEKCLVAIRFESSFCAFFTLLACKNIV